MLLTIIRGIPHDFSCRFPSCNTLCFGSGRKRRFEICFTFRFIKRRNLILLPSNQNTGLSDPDTTKVFVFAQYWLPGFCSGMTDYYGCNHPKPLWGKYFTTHGLWPQYDSGGPPYPEFCTTEAFNSSVPVEIGWEQMTEYWPNAIYSETDPEYDSFWEHEWSKHGTCTELSQYEYFSVTLAWEKTFGTPDIVSNNVGGSVDSSKLRDVYGGAAMVALQCNTGNFLSGVFTCWSQSNGKPNVRIVCPADVVLEDSCTDDEVHIQGFWDFSVWGQHEILFRANQLMAML